MKLYKLELLLKDTGIFVHEFIDNNKASEKYVRTTFEQADGFRWNTVVPYINRRAGLDIKTEEKLAEYLVSIKPTLRKKQWKNGKKRRRNAA